MSFQEVYMRFANVMLIASVILLLSPSSLLAQWVQPEGPWGGQIGELLVNKGTIFAGTTHGVYRSTNNGDNWTRLNSCPIRDVTTLAAKDSAVYVGAFSALFVTHDNGDTWTDLSKGLPLSFELFTLAIKGDTIFAGFDDDPIYYSADNGLTWKDTDELMTTFHLWVYGDILFAGSGIRGLFRSTNNGQTWTEVDSQCQAYSFANVDNTLLVGTGNGIIRSVDSGVTWEKYGVGISETAVDEGSIYDIIIINGVVFAASPQGVYTSTDKGAHWNLSATGLSNQGIRVMAVNGSTIFAGSSPRGAFRSSNNGASWEYANRGMSNLNVNHLLVAGDSIVAGCDGGILLSYNKGRNWQWADISRNIYVVSIVKSGDVLLAGTLGTGLFRSIDYGKHWSCIDSSQGSFGLLTAGNGGFFGKIRDTLMYLPESGTSWIPKFADNINTFTLHGDSIIVGAGKSLYRSTDNGNTWIKYDSSSVVNYPFPNSFVQAGTTLYSSTHTLNLANYRGISRSNDNGIHWTDVSSGLGDSSVDCLAAYGTTLFAGTSSHGVYISTNLGESWTSVSAETSISTDRNQCTCDELPNNTVCWNIGKRPVGKAAL